MAACRHQKYTGFVTNQDPDQPLDMNRAHMSTVCCDRATCIAATKARVEKFTGEPATFYSYAERWAARTA